MEYVEPRNVTSDALTRVWSVANFATGIASTTGSGSGCWNCSDLLQLQANCFTTLGANPNSDNRTLDRRLSGLPRCSPYHRRPRDFAVFTVSCAGNNVWRRPFAFR